LDLVIQLIDTAIMVIRVTDMVIIRMDTTDRIGTTAILRALRTTGTMGTVTTATIGIITTTATKWCRNLKLLSWLEDDFEPALFFEIMTNQTELTATARLFLSDSTIGERALISRGISWQDVPSQYKDRKTKIYEKASLNRSGDQRIGDRSGGAF
jgi:hypothetical protein